MKRFMSLAIVVLLLILVINQAQAQGPLQLTKGDINKHFNFLSVADSSVAGIVVLKVEITGKKQKDKEYSPLLVQTGKIYYLIFSDHKPTSEDWMSLRSGNTGVPRHSNLIEVTNAKSISVSVTGSKLSFNTTWVGLALYRT